MNQDSEDEPVVRKLAKSDPYDEKLVSKAPSAEEEQSEENLIDESTYFGQLETPGSVFTQC